jgi:hypothetical protein
LKEVFVSNDLFRGACNANGELFYDAWFDVNFNFYYGRDVGHVSFFKSIRGRDRVVELVNVPRRNKILGFYCA